MPNTAHKKSESKADNTAEKSNKTTSKRVFVEKNLDLVFKLISEGKFEYHVYTALGITKPTWVKFKKDSERLRDTIERAKLKAVEELVPKLKSVILQNALGYEEPEAEKVTYYEVDNDGNKSIKEKVVSKKYQPDTKAAHLMLKNLTKDAINPNDRWYDDPMTVKLKEEKLALEKELADLKKNGF